MKARIAESYPHLLFVSRFKWISNALEESSNLPRSFLSVKLSNIYAYIKSYPYLNVLWKEEALYTWLIIKQHFLKERKTQSLTYWSKVVTLIPYLETPIINSSSPGTNGSFPSCFRKKTRKVLYAHVKRIAKVQSIHGSCFKFWGSYYIAQSLPLLPRIIF